MTRLLRRARRARRSGCTRELRAGRQPELPGAVRASIGLGTTAADIDALVEALYEIAQRGARHAVAA